MIERKELPDGTVFIQHDCMSYGDYSGSNSLGAANIRSLRKAAGESVDFVCGKSFSDGYYDGYWREDPVKIEANLVICDWPYHTEEAWVKESWDEGREMVEALEDYPVVDEMVLGEVESEWEAEAWESWLRYDLIRTGDNEMLSDLADDVPDDALYECYRQAMEDENEYPVAEGTGVYVNVDRISETFWKEATPLIGWKVKAKWQVRDKWWTVKWAVKRWIGIARYYGPLILRGKLDHSTAVWYGPQV